MTAESLMRGALDVVAIGLSIPQMRDYVDKALVRDFCAGAEGRGFASLWVIERLLRPVEQRGTYGGETSSYQRDHRMPQAQSWVLSPIELLTAAAMVTDHVRLGTSVLVMSNHWPVDTAKRYATLDVLSGGRLVAGLGVGWSEEEHIASGVAPRTRGRRTDEFLDVLLACWTEEPVEYRGEFFAVSPSSVGPKPLQRPRPKVILGMWSDAGKRRTVRVADGWNSGGGMTVRDAAEALAQMNEQRLELGMAALTLHHRIHVQDPGASHARDFSELVQAVRDCREYGVDELIVDLNVWEAMDRPAAWMQALAQFGELVEVAKH